MDFQRTKNSQEWYTPRYITDALGHFDLDPCAARDSQFHIATRNIDADENGLLVDWGGQRVWLNPPYKHPIIDAFIEKMILNNNGIALLFVRCDNSLWQDRIFPTATALLFIRNRVRFIKPDGNQASSAGCGSVLVAWGAENAVILKMCNIIGTYIDLKNRIS